MLTEEMLLDAMAGAADRDILAAGRALGYLPEKSRPRRNLWRPLLIAALLGALLTGAAVAATLLGRAERIAPMPPDPSGAERQAEIPNGFRGTPTYQGSSQWWAYMAQWEDSHDPETADYSLDFIEGDLNRYLVCSLYRAYTPEQAEKLYEIADTYGLQLYREQIYFGRSPEEFYELTEVAPFLNQKDQSSWGGSVLEDGSFYLQGSMQLDGLYRGFILKRYYSGSIYPFGGADSLKPFRETEYETSRGERVFLDVFGPGDAEVTYQDPGGKIYITLRPSISWEEDPLQVCRIAADTVDFKALCQGSGHKIREILDQPTGVEDNPEAVRRIQAFQESPAFLGAREFGIFYRQNFYGPCFTGTYGMEGYPDIDRQLQAIGDSRGLLFAREKTWGNQHSRKAAVFDNGAWNCPGGRLGSTLHYIPKNALYTMMPDLPDILTFRRVWSYETEEGQSLVLFTQGPERESGSFAFYETESAWVLLELYGGSPGRMEEAAEAFDWSPF